MSNGYMTRFGPECSLRRIHVPERRIDLTRATFEGRAAEVTTAYGNMVAHRPECGLDQGEVSLLLLWLIFHDPLLTRMWRARHSYEMNDGGERAPPARVANGAFADD